jgi:hypothetical protein
MKKLPRLAHVNKIIMGRMSDKDSGLILNGYDKNQKVIANSAIQIASGLKELADMFPNLPHLLQGPLRHLKVEPHYREPSSRLWLAPQAYRKTSKIRLTGNWIEKAGFITHERIRVIPMHRMLIIVPETGYTNEHE